MKLAVGTTSNAIRPAEARAKLESVLDWIYTHSSDVLLHFHVFEWCFTVCDRYAMASNSPYLKDYLFRKLASLSQADAETYVRFLKLLAECAERMGDKWTAAKALFELGLHEVAQIHITDRVEYLSRSEMLCQTLKLQTSSGELAEFVSNLRIYHTVINQSINQLLQSMNQWINFSNQSKFDSTNLSVFIQNAKFNFVFINFQNLFLCNDYIACIFTWDVFSLNFKMQNVFSCHRSISYCGMRQSKPTRLEKVWNLRWKETHEVDVFAAAL